jgi:hypothetical protein
MQSATRTRGISGPCCPGGPVGIRTSPVVRRATPGDEPWQRYLATMRFPEPQCRGIAPLTAAGAKMSSSEYEEWRDAHTWDPSRGTGVVIETDLAPAAWIEPLLLGHWSAGLAMLPGGFEAYVRIFFPSEGEDEAGRQERIAAALTEPEAIILAGPDGQAEPEAYCGFLPRGEFNALLPILTRHTLIMTRLPGQRSEEPVRGRWLWFRTVVASASRALNGAGGGCGIPRCIRRSRSRARCGCPSAAG